MAPDTVSVFSMMTFINESRRSDKAQNIWMSSMSVTC